MPNARLAAPRRLLEARYIAPIVRLVGSSSFGLLGYACGLLGLHDAFNALSPLARIFGVGFLALGAASFVLALGYLFRAVWTYPLAFSVSVIAGAIASVLILSPWPGRFAEGRIVFIVAFICPLILVLVDYPVRRIRSLGFPALGRLSGLAAGSALLITVGQVWYTTQYLPSQLPPSLNFSAELVKLGSVTFPGSTGGSEKRIAIQVRLHIRNVSNTRVRVLASLYKVTGQRMSALAINDVAMINRSLEPALEPIVNIREVGDPVSKFAGAASRPVLIETGQIIPSLALKWYDPNQETDHNFVTYVPENAFDSLQLDAEVLVAKASAIEVEAIPEQSPKEMHTRDVDYVETKWWIAESSSFRLLTAPREDLTIQWLTREWPPIVPVYPRLGLGISSGVEHKDIVGQVRSRYGLEAVTARNQLCLSCETQATP